MRKQHSLFRILTGSRTGWFLVSVLLLGGMGGARAHAAEPVLSLTAGLSGETPQGAPGVRSGSGFRGGFCLPGSIPAAELRIPFEWGFALRTASLRFNDSFGRAVFTDLQLPILFHGDLFGWKYLEPLAIWTPSYTLDMVTKNKDGEEIGNSDALRTRVNVGFGAGAQLVYRGFRLRTYASYNILPPITGADLTFTDWVVEAAVPLFWKSEGR